LINRRENLGHQLLAILPILSAYEYSYEKRLFIFQKWLHVLFEPLKKWSFGYKFYIMKIKIDMTIVWHGDENSHDLIMAELYDYAWLLHEIKWKYAWFGYGWNMW
jgi:hypothetical protein